MTTETICALATPNGNASVGIIRISGPNAHTIAKAITRKELKSRFAHFTSFFDSNDEVIDQGIAIYFSAPNSFTGEDVVELQPHGNPYVCESILKTLHKHGARQALAGEFSERAFLNGKLDLTQLEAIADLISSGSEHAARSAVHSMQGKFSLQVNIVQQQLIQIRTHIEASLDFSEEDIETETREAVLDKLEKLDTTINELFVLAQQGAQLQQGVTVVLTGSPNVGKSSLFNALCANDRAIVTNVPGTTRDIVSIDMHLNGVPVRLLDTAGIRDDAEKVEQEGIARAHSALEKADAVVHVYDATDIPASIDNVQENEISVVNKTDLVKDVPKISKAVCVSAKTGEGIEVLRNEIIHLLHIQPVDQQAPFSARQRHLNILQTSREHIESARKQITGSLPLELAAEECRIAQQTLGEITGEFTPDDLLDYVFREFCIGK